MTDFDLADKFFEVCEDNPLLELDDELDTEDLESDETRNLWNRFRSALQDLEDHFEVYG